MDEAGPGSHRRPTGRRAAVMTLIRAGYRATLVYRAGFLFTILGVVVQVVVLVLVWRAAYAGRPTVAGVSDTTTVAYAALAASFQAVAAPRWVAAVGQRIRLGQIGVDMMRPLTLIAQTLTQSAGALLASGWAAAAGLVTGWSLDALRPPPTVAAAAVWLLSMTLGLTIALIANLAVSLLAFWTLELDGPTVVYQFASLFLSGALIPLWFMPDGLRRILGWLPFEYQMYAPLTIWFGRVQGAEAARVVGLQVVWIVVLWALVQLIWRRALRRVVVLGG